MADVELIMPKMGESIMEAQILKWLKNPGDSVEADESVLEIATDKVDSEVPAPQDGVIKELLYNEGDTVEVGKAIAIISTEGESSGDGQDTSAGTATESAPGTASQPEPGPSAPAAGTATAPAEQATVQAQPTTTPGSNGSEQVSSRGSDGRFYSPLVRNIARNENIFMEELEQIPGSGKNNRVTKKDILAYVQNRQAQPAAAQQQEAAPAASQPQQAQPSQQPAAAAQPQQIDHTNKDAYTGNDTIEEMDRMRKLIRDHMVESKRTSAHVTSFVEADVSKIVKWREANKQAFEQRHGEKLTYTPVFVEALIKAIKDFPRINSSVDGDNVVIHNDVHLGVAAALPNYNLIVPVIRNADQYNMSGIAKHVNDLSRRARDNKLKPDEIGGGTFTLSNVGTFGNLSGTPIINQPQVAVLATGSIQKKPVVVETEYGDTIAIRHMMMLSLSYDHRVIDGAYGGATLRRIADYLEQFEPNRDV